LISFAKSGIEKKQVQNPSDMYKKIANCLFTD